MPLTGFQREVARLLAAHRNPESYVAGGAPINRSDSSPRYSDDLDLFHDVAESVAACAIADINLLRESGYTVDLLILQPGFYRAVAGKSDNQVRLDWTNDSAFRFFPVQPDGDFGYCLHPADLAVNKILAFAGRREIRDFLDVLYLHKSYLGLGASSWAACGKDPGYTPALILDQMNRHASYTEGDLRGENLAQSVDLRDLKAQWITAREGAEALCAELPEAELGCLYLNQDNNPVTPDLSNPDFQNLRRHFGTVRGAWPQIRT
jgi:hypothetical protein